MKRKCALKIALMGVLTIALILNIGAATYNPSELTWTSRLFPDTVCSWTSAIHNVYAGNNVTGAGTNCPQPGAQLIDRGFAYWKFVNITPAASLAFNCTTVGGPGAAGNGRPLLWRVLQNWSNETMTYNNQPAYCEGDTCWNVIGGLQSNLGDSLRNASTANNIEWDISSIYGFGTPLDEIYLFFADENTNSFSHYYLADCFLKAEGLFEYSNVTVFAYDNYAAISGLEVQICELDYINCATKFTDSDGIAEFDLPFGTYNVDAEYAIMNMSYSVQQTFSESNETVNIYFNTVGPGSIGGFVYWPNGTGAPLAIVNVSGIENYASVTELDGQFLFSPITKGNYTIQAFKAGLESELSNFRCTGDDSINLNLQAGVTPPDGFTYTYVNISTFTDVTTPLPYVNVERWAYLPSCPESCFIDSNCRNANCIHAVSDNRITSSAGLAILNYLPPNVPMPNRFYLYGYKSGYVDDYKIVVVESNYTPVSLYFSILQNTSITLHELNDLQNVYVRVTPNIGASQSGYTDAGGNITFSFPAALSRLIVNATINNVNYDPFNFIYAISGNPVYIAFEMPNRTVTSFNLYGYLFDNIGNNVSGARVELRCPSCVLGSCGFRRTNQDGYYEWTNVPFADDEYRRFCLMHATPPTAVYGDGGWLSVYPEIPDTYFNMTNGLILVGGNITPGMVYVKGLVTDITTDEPILDGNFQFIVNGTTSGNGRFTNGYVYIENLNPGSNLSMLLSAINYEDKSYLLWIGTSNYENDRVFALKWIGGATTRPTTTLWDTPTFPTTVPSTTTTTVLFIPENITVYVMANESEYILDTIWNAGISCIGAMLLLSPAAAAIGLLIAVLFGMKVIDALMDRKR